MKVSVCMGTYNGEKYIEEQLESILHQTKTPEEVILCDDGSTDNTVALIRGFIEQNHLEASWKLYCNQENKGYPGNFYYAMSLCTREVVFLADQDDIWQERKIERMCEAMEQEEKCKVLCCKFGLIDEAGSDIHALMSPVKSNGSSRRRKVTVADVFYKCEWPGMVLCYRNEWYRENVFLQSRIPHDFLICAMAAEEDGFVQLDEELAYHRRHGNNAGGEEHRITRLLNKQRKLAKIEDYRKILDAFEAEEVMRTDEGREVLRSKQLSMQHRYEALQSGSLRNVWNNGLRDKKNIRPATLICDILIVKQK